MRFHNIFSFHENMEERIRAHIGYYICMLVLSILLSIFYQYINLHNIKLGADPDYVNMVIAGISYGLFFLSVILLIRNYKLLKNKEQLRKLEIMENDERNQLISLKAHAYTSKGAIIGCFVASLITAFRNIYLSKSLAIVGLCLMLVVFLINRFLHKRM